jgi:hypothetical protein
MTLTELSVNEIRKVSEPKKRESHSLGSSRTLSGQIQNLETQDRLEESEAFKKFERESKKARSKAGWNCI